MTAGPETVPRWSLNAVLAALPLALIFLGPVLVAEVDDRSLIVSASQLALAVLIIHIGFSVLARRRFGAVTAPVRWLLAATVLLAAPLAWATDPGAGAVAYLNFASGTVGGIAIAQVWKGMPTGYSWLDVGYLVFLLGGMAQLLVAFSAARSVTSLHQSSQTPWGNSNFVAGCLVVAALVVMARSARMGRHRKYAIAFGLVAIGVALLTLSRGAIIATCVGATFFLWARSERMRPSTGGSTRGVRAALGWPLTRVLIVLIPVAAYFAIDHVTALRAEVNDQVYSNVDIRVALYKLAWEEFLESPLTGTGWASFRDAALANTGQSQTFAHNLVLSMLQIGGTLSLPYLAALAFLAYRALRRGGPYAAAVAAAIAVSMTDPFFESTAGNLIILPVAILAGVARAATDLDGDRDPLRPTQCRSAGARTPSRILARRSA